MPSLVSGPQLVLSPSGLHSPVHTLLVVTSAGLRGLRHRVTLTLIPEDLSRAPVSVHSQVGGAALSIHGNGHTGSTTVPGTLSEFTPYPANFTIYVSQTLKSLFSSIVPATFVTDFSLQAWRPRKHVGQASVVLSGRVPHHCWGGGRVCRLTWQKASVESNSACTHSVPTPWGCPGSQPGS